jgi:hypothetical protein
MHFLTLALDEIEWSASCPGCCTPRERAPGIHWIGGWGLQSQSGHSVKEKNSQLLPGIEPRSYDCPACSQPLYQLAILAPTVSVIGRIFFQHIGSSDFKHHFMNFMLVMQPHTLFH